MSACLALCLIAQPTFSRTTFTPSEKRQQLLARIVNVDVPRDQSTLLTSLANLKVKIMQNDPVLKRCSRPDCTLALGNPRKTERPPLVFMFGDSHVHMWLPAVYSALIRKKVTLRVSWAPGCPAALVHLWGVFNGAKYGETCDAWRDQTKSRILQAKPDYVILAERTSTLFTGPDQRLDGPTLRSGLENTIRYFQSGGAKVVVIADTPPFANWLYPSMCVSVNMTTLTRCQTTVVSSSPDFESLGGSEALAAQSTGANFIDPTWWLCEKVTQRCPSVIDDKLIYRDSNHIAFEASYGLADLMSSSLLPILTLVK